MFENRTTSGQFEQVFKKQVVWFLIRAQKLLKITQTEKEEYDFLRNLMWLNSIISSLVLFAKGAQKRAVLGQIE